MTSDINLDDVYASEWLNLDNFPNDGLIVTITEVGQEKNPDLDDIIVVRLSHPSLNGKFPNGRKRGLNRTQAKTLVKLLGGTGQWPGQQVYVRPEPYNSTTDTLVFFRPPTPQPPAQPGAGATPPPTPDPVPGGPAPAPAQPAAVPPPPGPPIDLYERPPAPESLAD